MKNKNINDYSQEVYGTPISMSNLDDVIYSAFYDKIDLSIDKKQFAMLMCFFNSQDKLKPSWRDIDNNKYLLSVEGVNFYKE